jgi:hypothetical protein
MSTRDRAKHPVTKKSRAKTPSSRILALQRDLQGRFVSTGGRPSDPAPTIRRLITVKKEVWKRLQKFAALLTKLGDRVSPGQLAATLLEKSVTELGFSPPRTSKRLSASEIISEEREDRF